MFFASGGKGILIKSFLKKPPDADAFSTPFFTPTFKASLSPLTTSSMLNKLEFSFFLSRSSFFILFDSLLYLFDYIQCC